MNSLNIRGAVDQLSQPQAKDAKLMIGVITATPTGLVEVEFAGGGKVVTRFVAGYSPVIGDAVQVLRTSSGMYVTLGKLSKVQGASAVITTSLNPVGAHVGVQQESWGWETTNLTSQGRFTYGVVDYLSMAAVWRWSPDWFTGKTVTAMSVVIRRAGTDKLSEPSPNMRTPRLYLHDYTGQPSSTPTWESSVWSPGQIYTGQQATFALPDAWRTALASGAATGIGAYSNVRGDFCRFHLPTLIVSYY